MQPADELNVGECKARKARLSTHHFFSGIGRGTGWMRQGTSTLPDKLRPSTEPTKVKGNTTNIQMQITTS